jgi:undecaprenyl-diphosphatase
MPFYTIIILALVQGITEFLPISSSGHLVLAHQFMGNAGQDLCWEQNRMMDVAVHVGTLLAVLLYFRRDVSSMICDIGHKNSRGHALARHIGVASIPVLAAGFVVNWMQPSLLCLIEVMAWMTLIFGVVLGVADKYCRADKTIAQMTDRNAFFIGLAQTLALVPGVSRSGITMTAGRILGYSRTETAHFSLLLAIVAISAAGGLATLDMIRMGDWRLGTDVLIAVVLSFVTGYAAIVLMMSWLSRASFMPFAVYRVILGAGLLFALYSGWM